MKNSKQVVKRVGGLFLLLLTFLVVLTGCGNTQEQTAVYEGTFNGVEMRLTYYAKGDRVYKQTAENVIPYSALGVTSEEEARVILDPASAQYQGIEGLEETLEYGGDSVRETLSVDFEKVNFDEIQGIPGIDLEGDTSQGVSLKRSGKSLEESGFVKVSE